MAAIPPTEGALVTEKNTLENHQYIGVKMPVKSVVVCRVKELF